MQNVMTVVGKLQAAIIAAGLKTIQIIENEALEATKKLESVYREASRKMCQNPTAKDIERY